MNVSGRPCKAIVLECPDREVVADFGITTLAAGIAAPLHEHLAHFAIIKSIAARHA